jgi:N-acetylmuramoyl-L-alanine amidase
MKSRHFHQAVLAALFCLWSLPGDRGAGRPDASMLQIFFEDDPVSYAVSAFEKDHAVFISIDEFADVLGFTHYTNPQSQKTIIRIGSHSVKVSPFNPFLMIDDDMIQMPLSTSERNGRLFIPVVLFLDALGGNFPFRPDLEQDSRVLRLSKIRYNIVDFEAETKGNGILIRLHTGKTFSASDIATSISQGWLHITLYGGTLDTIKLASEGIPGIFRKLLSFQSEHSAQMSFQFERKILDRKVTVGEGTVSVSVWTSDKLHDISNALPEKAKARWLIDTIVIDPGHGGRDPGAIGPTGAKEKDINLAIAFRLKSLLERRLPQAKVLMTRTSDVLVGLKDRWHFANVNGGKLFISIHTNANDDRRVRGFSTYFLGVGGKTREAIEVAQKENSVVKYEDKPEAYEEYQDFDYILNAIALSSYLKESQDLATMVNESMWRFTKVPDQGVHQQFFQVLIGASMPRVLVETAFLSNANEERLLKTRSFQQNIAEALCQSIEKFKTRYEKEIG